ncbi:MAG: hypothetical protein RLY85_1619 [Bacteroidota bacterium]|jgi:hypothetical protein
MLIGLIYLYGHYKIYYFVKKIWLIKYLCTFNTKTIAIFNGNHFLFFMPLIVCVNFTLPYFTPIKLHYAC